MCRYLAKYKEWTLMKIVITIVGQDRVGIIAMVSNILAEKNVNILNINQNIVDGFFNMVMIADMTTSKISLKDLQQLLRAKGEEINLDIKVQHEDIFQIMHRI
jgi:ACT domain-containing protein